MKRDELKKLVQGIICTVPTPFDDDFEVDYGRMAELTRFWVDGGLVAGKALIKVGAAMGEGPMLDDTEWPFLLRTVVQASGGKAAIAGCIHHKDTRRTIKDAKLAQDLGAIALQIAPPVFGWPTPDDILRYFEAVSNAIDIGIIVYNQPWWPNGGISPATYARMKDFEHLVAIKWSNPNDQEWEEMFKMADVFNILDNNDRLARSHRLGARGYINRTAHVYPPHDLRIWELLEAKRYDEAQKLFDSVNDVFQELYAKYSVESGGEGRLVKGFMAAMGKPVGSSRPPTLPLSKEQMAEIKLRLAGAGWPVPK